MFISAVHMSSSLQSFSLLSIRNDAARKSFSSSVLYASFLLQMPAKANCSMRCMDCFANSEKSSLESDMTPKKSQKSTSTEKTRKTRVSKIKDDNSDRQFPPMVPKKPRRGRKSEAAAVEDFVRDSLGRTFDSIRQQNPDILKDMENIMKKRSNESNYSADSSEDEDDSVEEKEMLVEEEDPNWPLDADVGWGIRASEYFEQHPIRNVLGEDGNVIDWEGEIDKGLVKEINCLEWESFAFHPSPLIVLVFERYNRSSDNWKVLKELEKAAMVYWEAKDRLPPRTVKIDMNIERDLAYALKVKECPQILFLRGNKMLYREKDIRSADELVQMIAFFYYNARKPSCINEAALIK